MSPITSTFSGGLIRQRYAFVSRRPLIFRVARILGFATVVVGLGVAAGAWAYFTSLGTGYASASVGTLAAPTGATASVSGTSVSVAWTGVSFPTGGGAIAGYYVQRFAGASAMPA